ncbi:MAG: hypothetical protein ACT4OM_02535 [Actinomycetota bacterium]
MEEEELGARLESLAEASLTERAAFLEELAGDLEIELDGTSAPEPNSPSG